MRKKGYLFISNSSKPNISQLECRDTIKLNYFSLPCIEAANSMGYEVHMGVNRNKPQELEAEGYDIKFYDSHTYRNIFNVSDIYTAYKNTCEYLSANRNIEVIHCNTPIGGVIGRLCGHKFGCKVIYTAHGFHFFKGAPLFNRTVLKWIECWLAHFTDAIITINQEDFETAKQLKLKQGGNVFKVPGVGINTSNVDFSVSRKSIRTELGLSETSTFCIAVGDLNSNKNYQTLLKAIEKIKTEDIVLMICGIGPDRDSLQNTIDKLHLQDKIKLLGFRTDIARLFSGADIFLMSSKREGLPRSTMEAMSAGLPCIVSDVRGNRDLIENGKGGYLVDPNDAQGFAHYILELKYNSTLMQAMSQYNIERVKNFDVNVVRNYIKNIYRQVLDK